MFWNICQLQLAFVPGYLTIKFTQKQQQITINFWAELKKKQFTLQRGGNMKFEKFVNGQPQRYTQDHICTVCNFFKISGSSSKVFDDKQVSKNKNSKAYRINSVNFVALIYNKQNR